MIIAPEGGTIGEITLRSVIDPLDTVPVARPPCANCSSPM